MVDHSFFSINVDIHTRMHRFSAGSNTKLLLLDDKSQLVWASISSREGESRKFVCGEYLPHVSCALKIK